MALDGGGWLGSFGHMNFAVPCRLGADAGLVHCLSPAFPLA